MNAIVTQTMMAPANGVTLHVETAGPADGPLVILLHGFPESWYGWANQIGMLARSGYRVAVPDLRGYGLSERPRGIAPYRKDALAADVAGLIDHFGREKAVIVGHDWGGVIAWHVAMHLPGRVERLVVLNAPHPAAMNRALLDPATGQFARSAYVYFFQIPGLPEALLRAGGFFLLKRMTRGLGRPGSFDGQEIPHYVEAWRQPGALTAMLNYYRAVVREALGQGRKATVRKEARRVRVPALLLWGERDPALSPVLAPWSLEWCDNGRLVRFPEATHWLQHDEAARVSARILDFIK